jgi:N-acetylglutamate synthase-like GNAT family acetyltransferase
MSTDKTIHLRNARAEDSPKIKALIYQVGINPLDLNWRHFVIAYDINGEFLACGQVKKHRDGSLELASIAVKPELRNNGVASRIIDHLIETHPPPLYLTCREKLGTFYEKFGFHVIKTEDMPPYFRRIARIANMLGGLKLIPGDLLVMKLDP